MRLIIPVEKDVPSFIVSHPTIYILIPSTGHFLSMKDVIPTIFEQSTNNYVYNVFFFAIYYVI